MKKIAVLLVLIFTSGIYNKSDAQVLKGLGKRIEKKVNDRIDRKADRNVDKVLDKADSKTDKPIDDILSSPSKSNSKKEERNESVSNGSMMTNNAQNLSEGLLMMSSSNCTDFIWFKSGAMMEFENTDSKGKVLNKSIMNISKVYDEGGVTIADVKASDGEGNTFDMQFKCAGDKMYMDFGSLIKQAMQKAGQTNGDDANIQRALDNTQIDFTDGFMAFPKSMFAGQQLDDVSVVINSSPSPQLSMEIISALTERQVVAKEKISTPAGNFDCVKISGVRKTSMKVMGLNKKMKPFTEYIWFAPGVGVIKQEDYDENGKLGTSMQLTAYKL